MSAPARDVAVVFVRWVFLRAILHRGWWLVTSLYLVAVADLSAFQLVFLGTAQNLVALLFEVPTGVVADTLGRKRSIVLAHLLMGSAMLATGLVTGFPALVAAQMLWGLAWTFSTGADVAWLHDELNQPERVASVLTASARWEQIGAAAGLVGFGALAWATELWTAIVVAGAAMCVLGAFVHAVFTEHGFEITRDHHWQRAVSILRGGVRRARSDREILLVLGATVLVNGAAEPFGRLFPKRLLELGFPEAPAPIAWLTALGLVALMVGALVLRVVEARIDGAGVARRAYAAACLAGAFGLLLLALAPDDITGMAGVVLVSGIAWTLTRTVSVIWVNRRTPSDVRATVQSLLAQAEYCGEILLGVSLGILAQATSISLAMFGGGVLVAGAGVWVMRSRSGRAPVEDGDSAA